MIKRYLRKILEESISEQVQELFDENYDDSIESLENELGCEIDSTQYDVSRLEDKVTNLEDNRVRPSQFNLNIRFQKRTYSFIKSLSSFFRNEDNWKTHKDSETMLKVFFKDNIFS